MTAAEAWDAALPIAPLWVLPSVAAWLLSILWQWGSGVAVAVGEAHSPIANLFRCYFAILITGAEAVLVADAARSCVLQPLRRSSRPQPKTLFGGPTSPHWVEEIKCAV